MHYFTFGQFTLDLMGCELTL